MYALGYNKLFWGMIFIIFDINLGTINILPNFIGYMLIYSALNILEKQHEIYKKGKIPAMILTILTLNDIIHTDKNNLLSGEYQSPNFLGMLIGTIVMIISIYLIYIICKGIYYISIERGFDELKESTETRWRFYLGIEILMLFYMPFSLNISQDFNFVIVVFCIIKLIIMISIAMLFRRSKSELGESSDA
ncbi:hypothetical protein [Clostridium lundense]|uniref:hypothetical protein n=1 Tax=Clostridium lundense TaxID=319475 RepID=UPI0004842180|nr:hypothetical protein [Clostridium lundense]